MTTLVKILKKDYENKLKNFVVMDDYDGGKAAAYREIINDLGKTLYRYKPSASLKRRP
tara:strand:- start:317 stop:490 length:174 start_codon:yes stop_codon:yes gene_type:complete